MGLISVDTALADMRALPYADLDTIAPRTSLILAPHPDDESLGCGGLIAACCAAGRPPVLICVTDGTGSHPGSTAFPAPSLRALRAQELLTAAGVLGLEPDRIHFLNLTDTRCPSDGPHFAAAVHRISALAKLHRVTTIFASWRHDPHCDHAATAAMGASAARDSGAALRHYPVWGWLLPHHQLLRDDPIIGWRLDIRPLMHLKQRAIAAHASQYGGLITDDPSGFVLPAELLGVFSQPFEVFLKA